MTKEIIDAVSALEKEKGIDGEVLLTALEDALLAAYKKTPGAARHAKVELDRDTGDIRVLALTLPEEDLLAHPGVTMPEPVEPEEPLAEGEEPEEPEPIIDWSYFSGD